jgi:hypothetical protein
VAGDTLVPEETMDEAPGGVRFARRVFTVAAIYGIVGLVPQYFMEQMVGRDFPPPITHPEHYYGFIGVALAWQFFFLIMARDPVRYRLAMLPATFEKLSFGVATIVLYQRGRVPAMVAGAGAIDLVFALLFVVAFQRVRLPHGHSQ